MQMIPATAEWARHWLYDWGGANVSVLLSVNRNLAPRLYTWLPGESTFSDPPPAFGVSTVSQ